MGKLPNARFIAPFLNLFQVSLLLEFAQQIIPVNFVYTTVVYHVVRLIKDMTRPVYCDP